MGLFCRKIQIVFGIGLVVFLILVFRPMALVQGILQEYSDSKILVEYEIYGCGSLVTRVVKGGEMIAAVLSSSHPNVATNEVRFTEDSDEPYLHLNSAEFWTAGLARGYQYIVEGEVTGVVKGALKCCAEDENDVAYNEIVPEFRVKNWYTSDYMPYYKYGNPLIWLAFICGAVICAVGLICGLNKKVAPLTVEAIFKYSFFLQQ